MIRRSRSHAVVEVMGADREIRLTFSKLVDVMAFPANQDSTRPVERVIRV